MALQTSRNGILAGRLVVQCPWARLGPIMLVLLLAFGEPVADSFGQVLDDSCFVTVNGQTVQVNPDGTFFFVVPVVDTGPQDNVGDDFFQMTGTCTSGGARVYVSSECFQITLAQTYEVQTIDFASEPPITVASLLATPAIPVLTAIGQTTKIDLLATFGDGSKVSFDPSENCGTSFRSSNRAIAAVGPDGMVTALASGTALITATNTGATSTTTVAVSPGDPLTTVVGILIEEGGTPIAGATVSLIGFLGTDVTDANGAFSITGIPSFLGDITALATPNVDGVQLVAQGDPVPPISAGFTDVGLLVAGNRISWTSTSSGSWHTASNWFGGFIPGPGNIAVIDVPDAAITVTHSTGTTNITALECSENLTLSSGTLSTDQDSFVDGTLTLSSGTLTGSGDFSVSGGMTWTAAALTGTGDFIIEPGATWSASAGFCLTLSRPFINHGTGGWSVCVNVTNTIITNATDGTINFIAPNFNSIATSGTSSFFNDGTLNADHAVTIGVPLTNNGMLNANAGTVTLSGSGSVNNGLIDGDAGSVITFGNSTTLAAGSTLITEGSVTVNTGTCSVLGTYESANTSLTSGTLNFNTGGVIELPTFTASGGTLGGADDVSVTSAMTWTGTALTGTGDFIIEPGATWSASAGFCLTLSRPFINHGTGDWSVCVNVTNTIITNATDGTINFIAPNFNSIATSGTSSFFNDDTLNADHAVTIGVPLTNNGTLNANAGTVTLSGSGSVNNGLIDGDAGSVITFGNSTTLAAGSTLITEGSVTVNTGTCSVLGTYESANTSLTSGTLNFNTGGVIELPTFTASGGTLGGADDVSVTSSMTWTATALTGTGDFIIEPGATWSASAGFCLTLSRPFINHGTGDWSVCVNVTNTTITNAADGTINFIAPNFNSISRSGTTSFLNEGALAIATNTTLTLPFMNQPSGIIRGSAALNVSSSAFTQSGIVNPGTSPGNLTLTGNLPNTSTAVTNIELGGLVQGTEYDKLTVSGNATLDGTLNIILINGFQPQLGDTFTIMTYGSFTGAFDTIVGADLGGGLEFDVVVNTTSITLEVIPATGFHRPQATHR